ncbi:Fungal-trans domain-containing protein [Fusarium sp. LHS14.1]|nr:Fungal-trans domain-containing protein [Fusarium sp. LHS14.1]
MPRSSGSSSERRLRSATPSFPQKKSIAFLDRILQENAELRARLPPSESPPVKSTPAPSHHDPIPKDDEDAAQNQILEESDWFAHTRSSDTPIWIGEIADAAFATRFRQFASSSKAPSHIPRTQFASDDAIRGLAATSPPWPSPPCARLLIETALQFLRHNYHIVRRSEVLSLSTSGFDHSGQGTNPASTAKMWALFAIGELRSSKCLNMDNNFPGLAYFAVASDAIHPELREHRVRVWWSVYILDRFLSSKIGLPLLISDDDISVDMPSTNSTLNSGDFGDHVHFMAVVRLAKIAGNISRSLYVRTPQRGTFLQRVERIREELNQWRDQLLEHMKHYFTGGSDSGMYSLPATSPLQLTFNQSLILATRPVLLFVFRRHIEGSVASAADGSLPGHTLEVAEACIRSARQSYQLLSQSWVSGDSHIFNYSYVQHLFSAAVILAIAGALGRETSQNDNDEFNLASGFLQQLERNGHFAAMEFYSHIKEIRSTLERLRSIDGSLLPSENPGSQHSVQASKSRFSDQTLTVTSSYDHGLHFVDDLPLDLSFLDDWIYENVLQQLCWEEQLPSHD